MEIFFLFLFILILFITCFFGFIKDFLFLNIFFEILNTLYLFNIKNLNIYNNNKINYTITQLLTLYI